METNKKNIDMAYTANYKQGNEWKVCSLSEQEVDDIRIKHINDSISTFFELNDQVRSVFASAIGADKALELIYPEVSSKLYIVIQNALKNKVRALREGAYQVDDAKALSVDVNDEEALTSSSLKSDELLCPDCDLLMHWDNIENVYKCYKCE